jgi:hypothetical protein
MNFAPSASQYRERDFVSVPEGPTPRPFNIEKSEKRSIGRPMSRAFARYSIVFLIGIGATLAWQSYSDEAMETRLSKRSKLANDIATCPLATSKAGSILAIG